MKRRIIITELVILILLSTACNRKIESQEQVSLQGFVRGENMAYRKASDTGFYISDLNLDTGEWDSYSIGDMIDLDNDGEEEQIINGPYGGMYLDCIENRIIVFAEGEGTAAQLSYVYYEDAYWIVVSDTTHAGRQMFLLTKYAGTNTIVDSFELYAEYYDQDFYNEDSDFTYRGKKITMEEYDQIYKSIFGN